MEKQFAHNKQLRECRECGWVLLYPDFDLVLTLPGKSEPFSVGHYKESIGRPYSRVNLYLCKLSDYESKNFYIKYIQHFNSFNLIYSPIFGVKCFTSKLRKTESRLQSPLELLFQFSGNNYDNYSNSIYIFQQY